MANITLKGNFIQTVGELPKAGSPSPDVRLTRGELTDISLAGFEGKVKIPQHRAQPRHLAAASARRFEKEAGDLAGARHHLLGGARPGLLLARLIDEGSRARTTRAVANHPV